MKACTYKLEGENLTALWTEFQKQGKASCPQTGAELKLKLDEEGVEPELSVHCDHCGMSATFKPGRHEGFGWAE